MTKIYWGANYASTCSPCFRPRLDLWKKPLMIMDGNIQCSSTPCLFNLTIFLVVNLWDHLTLAKNRRQRTFRVIRQGCLCKPSILWDSGSGCSRGLSILWKKFCYRDGMMCFATLYSHWRGKQSQWYFQLPCNHNLG